MSLTITDITEFGIVMVADTALYEVYDDTTEGNTFGFRDRTLFGGRKLFMHPQAKTGLATWGAGTIAGSVPVQYVIEKFLEDHSGMNSVQDVAGELGYILQTCYAIPAVFGVHVAGMHRTGAAFVPVCYEICNADPPYRETAIRDFKLIELRAPGAVASREQRFLKAGGDLRLFGPLSDAIESALPAAAAGSKGIRIPADSLEARREFFAAHIRFVSDLYASARHPRSIGGRVDVLSIGNDGTLHMP